MSEERNIPTPRPSDRPTFTVKIGGEDLSREYHVLSVVVTKSVNKISAARIVLLDGVASDGDFPTSNQEVFAPGKEVEILAGYYSDEISIFQGIITKHGIKTRGNKAPMLTVECKHKAIALTVGRKSAYFHDAPDSDNFNTIIGAYSIGTDIESTDVSYKSQVQFNATDWDYIVSRAEANGRLIFTNDDTIAIKKPAFTASPVLALTYGATILEFDAAVNALDELAAVNAQSWDMTELALVESEGTEVTPPEQGNIPASDLAAVAGLETYTLRHSGSLQSGELKAWADAQLLKSRLARIQGRVRCIGFASINPGDIIELAGVGERFNGKAFVSAIRQELSTGIWYTDVQFGMSEAWFAEEQPVSQQPAAGLLPAVSGLQVGIVTQLGSDPDGEHRVLVKMDLVNKDDDGVWCRVATLDAGNERGSFFRPEIGDEVILGFINDDPRHPVILGMLNSSAKPAPLQASDDNHEKGFVTREKIKMIFNDEKKSLQIETPNGNTILISDEKGGISITDENSNKITMDASGITIESAKDINLKAASGTIKIAAMNVGFKADTELKSEGGASGGQLTLGATTVLKGAMVQIN